MSHTHDGIRARPVIRLHRVQDFLGLKHSQIGELVEMGLLHPFKPYPGARAQVVFEDEVAALQASGVEAARAAAEATKASPTEPDPQAQERGRKGAQARARSRRLAREVAAATA